MKVLVTGSAGFIGFHLVEKLISAGYEVIGLDNLNDYFARQDPQCCQCQSRRSVAQPENGWRPKKGWPHQAAP